MEKLRELRESTGITQDVLAAYLNVGRNTISRYENGEREPDIHITQKLADYFDVTLDYLTGRSCDQIPPSFRLTPSEYALIVKYRALDERGRSNIVASLEHEFKSATGKQHVDSLTMTKSDRK